MLQTKNGSRLKFEAYNDEDFIIHNTKYSSQIEGRKTSVINEGRLPKKRAFAGGTGGINLELRFEVE